MYNKFFKKFFICFSLCIVVVSVFSIENTMLFKEHRLQWWLSAINWDNEAREYSGKNIKIAIIDSAVDIVHQDLRASKIETIALNDDIDNSLSHGTGIAGIICAHPSNKNGVLGIAPDAKILSFPVTDKDNDIDLERLISAVNKSVEIGVDVINISCGLHEHSEELKKAISKAFNNGITVVASAGNFLEDKILYPAAYDEVLAVGSISKQGEIISPSGKINKKIIYLPGENIVTIAPNNSYNSMFGTSPASAILTGIIAIVLEANPKVSNVDLLNYFNSKDYKNIDIKELIKEIGGLV